MSAGRKQRVRLTAAFLTAFLTAFVLVLALLGAVYTVYAGAQLVEIDVPSFVSADHDENGALVFALDVSAMKEAMYFPADETYPENQAADSLSLIVNPAGAGYSFQTGSTLSDVSRMLKEGGYKLTTTAWNWTTAEAEEAAKRSLTMKKTLPVDKFTVYSADGNGGFSASFDSEAAKAFVGDRVKNTPILAEALEALTVTSTQEGDMLNMSTWSGFSASSGVDINTVFDACGVTVKNISFTRPLAEVKELATREVSLVPYYILSRDDGGQLVCDLNRADLKTDLGFKTGTTAAAAIDSLRVQIIKTAGGFRLEVCSVLSDVDAVGILRDNGVKLTDLTLSVTE